jgi:hypothetical protein
MHCYKTIGFAQVDCADKRIIQHIRMNYYGDLGGFGILFLEACEEIVQAVEIIDILAQPR